MPEPQARSFIKKRLWHTCFPVNFAKFLRTPFLQNISGRLILNIAKYLRTLYHRTSVAASEKFINFPGKHQWRRRNEFIFLVNATISY